MTSSFSSLFSPLPSLNSPRAAARALLTPSTLPFPLSSASPRRSNLSFSIASTPPPLKLLCSRDSRGERADPIYHNRLVNLFVNRVLRNGNKSLAFFIVYKALKRIQVKTQLNPLLVLRQAVRKVAPEVTVKPRRVAGSTHQVPVELDGVRGRALAIRWLLKAARERSGPDMAFKLSCELMDAANGSGSAVRMKEMTLKMAEANRAFVFYN